MLCFYGANLRFAKENSDPQAEIVKSVRLKNGSLVLNGKPYNMENLKDLPEPLDLDKLFTVTNRGITAFFRSFSPLSNHYRSNFEVKGQKYTSMEKYLMTQKAQLFGDNEALEQMKKEDDPVTLKKLGKAVKNFSASTWISNADQFLMEGLQAKFSQNKDLGCFLKATGKATLAEANPHDRIFAIGQPLFKKDVWDKNTWIGENKLGKALMNVRDNLD